MTPTTPSAHRVRVDSSPVSSSPLRFLSQMIAARVSSAEARAHPDPTRDVWELAVWDPLPICLRLFCLFSPGHLVVYWLFLPTTAQDPRPSVTVLTTVLLGGLLSAQLFLLQASFSQQNKDTAVIHKEVLNEYDTKFVHPRLSGPVRDVGTQHDSDVSLDGGSGGDGQQQQKKQQQQRRNNGRPLNFVHTYTPTTIVNKGFQTHPNPNYAKHYDPDGDRFNSNHHRHIKEEAEDGDEDEDEDMDEDNVRHVSRQSRARTIGGLNYHNPNPSATQNRFTPSYAQDVPSSPIKKPAMRQPQFQGIGGAGGGYRSNNHNNNNTAFISENGGIGTGDGGSLGIYSHANSPLRKRPSAGDSSSFHDPVGIGLGMGGSGGGGIRTGTGIGTGKTRPKSPIKREGSPLKRSVLAPPPSSSSLPSSSSYSSYPFSSSRPSNRMDGAGEMMTTTTAAMNMMMNNGYTTARPSHPSHPSQPSQPPHPRQQQQHQHQQQRY